MEDFKDLTPRKEIRSYKLLYTILIELGIAAIITGLMMLYQAKYNFLSFINGLQVAGALLIVVGWFVFINHHGLFDVMTHGVKTFFLSFTKRKMEKSLLEVRLSKKKMPKYLFLTMWIVGTLIIVISFIIYNAYK